MKILHVTIPSKRMMETYIKMIRENYPKEEHVFYFLGKCPKENLPQDSFLQHQLAVYHDSAVHGQQYTVVEKHG